MSDSSVDRSRFTPAQRRRAEALILIHSLWPHIQPESANVVARWIVRGDAKIKVVDP